MRSLLCLMPRDAIGCLPHLSTRHGGLPVAGCDELAELVNHQGINVNNSGTSPAVPRRRLRTELKRARQQAGLTQEAVAAEMDWSLSKIIRIETGSVGVSTNDLAALLRLYEVDSAERTEDLVALARAARRQSWWSKYRRSVSPAYFQYLEYEADAVCHTSI